MQLSRSALYEFFMTGDYPTQDQFQDLIDSSYNNIDDEALLNYMVFSPAQPYKSGWGAVYENVLYTSDVDQAAGSFNPSNWTPVGLLVSSLSLTEAKTWVGDSTGHAYEFGYSSDFTVDQTGKNIYVDWANGYSVYDSRYLQTISGLVAGGDLAGDYPNPTVVWSHGEGTYDGRYAQLSGATFTGMISLYADASSNMQPVTLQQMNAALVGLWNDRGNYDASVNAFPSSGGSGTAGAIRKGDIWTISVAGTLGGKAVQVGDTVRALINTPGTTSTNWAIGEHDLGYTPISNTLTSGYLFVGNSSNTAAAVAMSGDASISNTGVLSVNWANGNTTNDGRYWKLTGATGISGSFVSSAGMYGQTTTAVIGSDYYQINAAYGGSSATFKVAANNASVFDSTNGLNIGTVLAGVINIGTGTSSIYINGVNVNTFLTTITGLVAGGDLSGTYPNPTVSGIGGKSITLSAGFLKYTGSAWTFDNSTYLTAITGTQVTTALGYTPYNSTNPSGYISGNQTITLSGDASGIGTTAITVAVNKFNGQLPSYYLSTTNHTEGTNLFFTNSRAVAAIQPGITFTGAVTLAADAASNLQPVTLQQMNAALVGLWNDRGNYDASVNAFPSSGGSGTAGAIRKGDIWTISVAGTLGGVAVQVGDTVRALINTPGTTSTNWAIGEHNLGYTPISNTLTSGYLFVGNSSNTAAGVALSGDASISNTGVLTVSGIGGKSITLSSGFLKYTGSAWTFDTNTYLTANQNITLSGDASGSGTTAITTTVSKIGGKSVSLGGSFTTSGAYGLTFTLGQTGNFTLPNTAADSLAALGMNQTFTGIQTWNSTVVASGGNAVGQSITGTLTAAANNDNLIALRISPTRNPGSYTGVSQIDIQASFLAPLANNSGSLGNSNLAFSSIYVSTMFGGAGNNLKIQTGAAILLNISNTTYAQIVATSGNFMVQNGGTYNDSGDRFQVVGTSLLNGNVKIGSGSSLQLGNVAATGLTAGALASTTNASIVIKDSTGQAYRIPCII